VVSGDCLVLQVVVGNIQRFERPSFRVAVGIIDANICNYDTAQSQVYTSSYTTRKYTDLYSNAHSIDAICSYVNSMTLPRSIQHSRTYDKLCSSLYSGTMSQ
jgi:hypothetical protein